MPLRKVFSLLFIGLLLSISFLLSSTGTPAIGQIFVSPLPSPPPVLSPQAEIALAYLVAEFVHQCL